MLPGPRCLLAVDMGPCIIPMVRERPIVALPNVVSLHFLGNASNPRRCLWRRMDQTPAGCCNGVQQHAAGGGQSQIVASLNVVNLHFFGDASSSRKGLQYSIDQSPGGWWLVPIQHSRGGRSLHQRLSLGTSLDMHAFHEEISTAAWTRPHGGWWLVSCGAPVVGERSQLTDTLPNPAPALLWICTRCMKRYTMPHAPNTWW
jgi:hypothetical protein